MNHALKKRVFSIVLVAIMVIGLAPMNAFATDDAQHTHAGGTATCTAQAVCECGEAYGELADHTPNEDGTACAVCGGSLVEEEPAEHTHTGGTATCTAQAVCECGEAYGELADHSPAEDDGDCTTAIVCSVCGAVTTEAAENHTPNEEGNACAICGAEIPVILNEEEKPTYNGGMQLGMTDCDYYNIIESSSYTLVPGATEYQYVLNSDDGANRQVVHVIEVDTTNPNVSVMPSFKNISADVDYTDPSNWGSITVTDHAAHAENDLGLNVIGGMNVSLSWAFTHPYGLLIYEGVVLHDSRATCETCGAGHPGGGYLVIYEDGTAELRDANAPLTGDEWMAQTVCFTYIVKDGENMHPKEDHTSDAPPRSVIGIKADGTLVMMMVDGRMAPYSRGFTSHEMAEIMISLGCVDAINCDGGGSSTFMTEREGSGELSVKSRFSDGSERQTLTALLVLSNVAATGEFDHAAIETGEKLVTPGSTVTFTAAGVDAAGGPADIPEGVSWQLEDEAMGTVEDGVFTSNGTVGTATVQMVYNGEIVGEGSVDVVIPTAISFDYPNMTAPYGKSINLDISGVYGNSPVALKAEDFLFELANDTIGTIEGTTFTAVEDVLENPSSEVTVTLVYNSQITASAVINLGRGSEVVYDFESGEESVANWTRSYKDTYTPDGYYFNDTFEVVSAEEGKVRNGNYSLKITSEGDSITCMNWCQTRFDGLGIDLTDAVSLSFWMYIPEGSHGLEWDIGSAIPVELGHEFVYGTGWQYFTVNVADIGSNVTSRDRFQLYHSDTNNTGLGYIHNEHPNYYADVVYYIDDITVNYSSAVDDNQAPVISNAKVSYEGVDTAVSMTGQTLPTNTVTFTANAADNMSGLDMSSVVVYVDGVAVPASCNESGVIATGDITLPNGGHVVRFEICDKMGNQSTFFEYYFALAGSNTQNTITYAPKDPTLANVAEDSVVWMDLTADAIEDVDTVVTIVDLDQNSTWELEHMELAYGFSASYVIDPENNDATISITRTGEVSTSGEAVLASLPIRVWSPTFHHDGLGNEDATKYRLVSVVSHVEMGILTEVDETVTTFGSLEQVTSTEWNSTRLTSTTAKTDYHIHTEIELEDEGATCTENGYSDRTFCEGCNSVIEWGTTETATGHDYAIDETTGLIQCSCGKKFTGTLDGIEYVDGAKVSDGWVGNSYYLDGAKLTGVQLVPAPDSADEFYYDFGEDGVCENKTKYTGVFFDAEGDVYRYAYLGELRSGWQQIGDDWYYFRSTTMAAPEAGYKHPTGLAYEFEENGKLKSGVWVAYEDGTRYWYGPDYFRTGWTTIGGKEYYFKDGYRYEGVRYVRGSYGAVPKWYDFGADGALVERLTLTGWIITENGPYYVVNGESQLGLICYEGIYYYVTGDGSYATDLHYVSSEKTNGLLPAGTYQFFENGQIANGLYEKDGILYYYTNGKPDGVGLIEIGGNYYYAKSGGKIVTGSYYATRTNDIDGFSVGWYEFAEDGKMLQGIVNKDGALYYYTNGKLNAVGLMELDGNYYYVKTGGLVVTGSYYITRTNDIEGFSVGWYEFAEDGKMLQGIVNKDGTLYYYTNGKVNGAGLIEIDGNYYYAKSSGQIVTGSYYVTRTNGIEGFSVKYYKFAEDGKLIK